MFSVPLKFVMTITVSLLFMFDHPRFETDENKFTVSKVDIVLGGGESKKVCLHFFAFFLNTILCVPWKSFHHGLAAYSKSNFPL
jgi:hypothetical protein